MADPNKMVMGIAALIQRENHSAGPFPFSGGVTHKLTPEQIEKVSGAIAAACHGRVALVRLACAFIRGEGNFDPDAENPNHERERDGIRSEDAYHDFGICQVNGDPSYQGWAGLDKSLYYLVSKIEQNLEWAATMGYPREVAFEAYNKGQSGAEAAFKKLGVFGCNYGRTVASRVDEYVRENLV